MNAIENILDQDDWLLRIEVEPNVGGDGPRVRLSGDSRAFHNLAAIISAMAEKVDRQVLPVGASSWFLMFGGDMPQFQFQGATFLSLDCSGSHAE